jgi:hypothetical protein
MSTAGMLASAKRRGSRARIITRIASASAGHVSPRKGRMNAVPLARRDSSGKPSSFSQYVLGAHSP